jgi:hypothetical protein
MLAVITPQINYFDSLKIKKVLIELSSRIKEGDPWEIEEYWERISEILVKPLL